MAKFTRSFVFLMLLGISFTFGQVRIEVDGGAGTTVADATKWAGQGLNDWNMSSWSVNAEIFLLQKQNISVGVLVGYQKMFWYELANYNNYNVSATRVLPVVRFGNRFFVDLAAGPYFFENFTVLGVTTNVGYAIKLSDQLSIPIKLNTSVVFSNPSIMPINLLAGISYSFK